MKKILSLFLAFALIFTLGFGISGVQAAQDTITVSASIDNNTAKVDINGVLTEGFNKKVNVIVYSPNNSRIDYMDDQIIESKDGSFSFSYILGRKEAGTYKVEVFGPDEGVKASATFTYHESEDVNVAPTVTISTSKTNYTNAATIEITASAADSDGSISKVEFYADNTKLGEDDTAPYLFSWKNAENGTYALKAIAYDNDGAAAESNKITIIVIHSSSGSASGTVPSVTPTPTPTVTPTPTPVPVQKPRQFRDVGKDFDWAREAIDALSSKGIIKGTGEYTFEPGANITRADFIMLLVRALDLKGDVTDNFKDVNKGDYYYNAAGVAKKLGISKGDDSNNFNPNTEISRQDMMVLYYRALNISGKLVMSADVSGLSRFSDRNDLADYAVDASAAMVKSGLIVGDNGLINPNSNTTRAETAVLVYRVLKLLAK